MTFNGSTKLTGFREASFPGQSAAAVGQEKIHVLKMKTRPSEGACRRAYGRGRELLQIHSLLYCCKYSISLGYMGVRCTSSKTRAVYDTYYV